MTGGALRHDRVFAGGTLVTPGGLRKLDVAVRDGLVAAVAPSLEAAGAEVVDVTGRLILPGAIDAHVHPIHGETLGSVSEGAAFGGVTTAIHHIYPEADRRIVDSLAERRGIAERDSRVDVAFHARLSDPDREIPQLPAVVEWGVRSFKMFTAYRQPGIAATDRGLVSVMAALGELGGILAVHAENGAVIEHLERRHLVPGAPPTAYLATRPVAAEVEAVHRVGTLARIAACPVYFVHVSSEAALAEVGRARAAGTTAYAETCPHYLTLTGVEALERHGPRAKIAPPLRTATDVAALRAAAADGRIATVGSDHCAFAPEIKEPPGVDIATAGFGAPGIETLLPLLIDGALTGWLPWERLVELVAAAPARIFGLARKGAIEPGRDADLVIVDPDAVSTIAGDRLHGAAYYSLYDGMALRGRIERVVLRGEDLVRGSELVGSRGRGRFVPMGPAGAS